MAGDFDINDEDYVNDNWENAGTDDFYRIRQEMCNICDREVGRYALDYSGRCEGCRAQPSRLTDT